MMPETASILVVEDEDGTRLTLCGILEDAGYKVTGLARGADALEMIRADSLNAVITDIRLPDVNGMEILELAREMDPEVAVIMITGYASVETAADAVNQGAYAYFIKPVSPEEMKTTIANALKQQRLSQENRKLIERLQRTNKRLLEANEELKMVINERRQAAEKHRAIVQTALDGFWISDLEGRLLEVNDSYCAMVGYSREELLTMSIPDIEALENPRGTARHIKKIVEQGFDRFETRHGRKDGRVIDVEVSVNYLDVGGGQMFVFVRDITERKQAEELYRTLANSSPVGVYIVQDGEFQFVNPQFQKYTGYSEEELLGADSLYIVHPEDRESVRENAVEMLRGNCLAPYEFRTVGKNGETVWAMETATSVDYKGKRATLGNFMDITERKQMENALRESEANYRVLAESSVDPIFLHDRSGQYLYANQACARVFGLEPWDIIGKSVTDLWPKEAAKIMLDDMENVFSKNDIVRKEHPVRLKGDTVYFLTTLAPVRGGDGQVVSVLGVAHDITEHKKMEEALRKSEERYRELADFLPQTVFETDIEGNTVFINRQGLQAFGVTLEDIKRNPNALTALIPEEFPRLVEDVRRGFGGEEVDNVEYTLRRKDGTTFPALIYAAPIIHEGEVVGARGITIDITERKKMERELQERNERLDAQNEELQSQAEELKAQQQELVEKTREVERANQLKSEFLARMSHELRTPLNVIIGFSELLMDEVPGQINQEQRQCLNDISDSSQHLLNLINEVLDLSKIESGKVELKLEDIALPEVIESLTRTIMPILAPRKQSLDIEIEPALSTVRAGEGKLGQVLLNLVDNASKATPDGGRLKIEAVREGDWCRLSVIDNGIGIKKKDQERIFEPFCQLENPLHREGKGTGLGLALVRQIIERYGGQIRVESEYGKGSRFTFTLPLGTGVSHREEGNRR